ncbi:MAG: hypothetical protein WB561_19755 [Terracidiphilus sp.]|jgi:hypothetical protein
MRASIASDQRVAHGHSDLISEVFHGMTQPLTALECGLELSLRYDKSNAQFRARVRAALESAQLLHQRVVELRQLLEAANPNDHSVP